MTDTSPEALIAKLERMARRDTEQAGREPNEVSKQMRLVDAETFRRAAAALRAAPVAMRERVWNEAVTASAQMAGLWSVPEDGPDMSEAEGRAFADGKLHAVEMVRKLLKPARPLDAPAPTQSDTEAGRLPGLLASQPGEASVSSAPAPAPVDPVADGEWTEERFRAVMATLSKPTMTSEELTALTRADAPPTLAEAMTVPEVRALVAAADAAIGHLVGYGETSTVRINLRAAIARLKGETP
jgi:hypothetical protein